MQIQTVQETINGLNLRLQELTIDEIRGRKINARLRRSLVQKRNEAHKQLKLALGKTKH